MLRTHPGVNVVIEGYTDSRGRPERNRELAVRRAEAVRRFLAESQLTLGRVTAAGMGADSSAAGHASAEAFARDRRVTLVFTHPDGTPLTPATYQLFDIDRESDLQVEQQHRPRPRATRPALRTSSVPRPTHR